MLFEVGAVVKVERVVPISEVLSKRSVPASCKVPHVVDHGEKTQASVVDDRSEIAGAVCSAELPESTRLGLERPEAIRVRRGDKRHPPVRGRAHVPQSVGWMRCVEVEDPGHLAVNDNTVVRREITVHDDVSRLDRRKPPLRPTRDVERRERVVKPAEEACSRAHGLVGPEGRRERRVADLALQEAHCLGLALDVRGDQPRNSDETDPFEMHEHLVDRLGRGAHRTYDGSADTRDAMHASREFLALVGPGVHSIDPRSTRQRKRATRSRPRRRGLPAGNRQVLLPSADEWSVDDDSARSSSRVEGSISRGKPSRPTVGWPGSVCHTRWS